jgi:serine protease AprX
MQRRKIISFSIILVIISGILIFFSTLSIIVPQSNLWALRITQINKLHDLGFDGSGVKIGIIDTGVDITHPEFESTTFIGWNDSINSVTTYYDDEDHGIHLVGILASMGSYQGLFSGVNLHGISNGVQLLIIKTIPNNQYIFGGGNDTIIAESIKLCINCDVDIILLSMGMSPETISFNTTSKTIEMIHAALREGIFVITPAGNDGQYDDGDVLYPALIDNVISVGAVSNSNSIASFSSRGHQYPNTKNPNKKPELVAPGERIMSTRINSGYGTLSGTPQAATYVTGILALLLDAYPEFKHNGEKNQNETTIQLFKNIFAQTAKKIGTLQGNDESYSHDDLYGYGLIQAYDAYKELGNY